MASEDITTALFGLAGVVVGAAITVAKEWWFDRKKEKKAASYLVIQVAAALERYAGECASVVGDDGTYMGQPAGDGYEHQATTKVPVFEPEKLVVEWSALPDKLLYQVFDFPSRARVANERIDYAAENSMPPDHSEFFAPRQFEYAVLGISAWDLAQMLRASVKLPARSPADWTPVPFMAERKAQLEAYEAARVASFVPPSFPLNPEGDRPPV